MAAERSTYWIPTLMAPRPAWRTLSESVLMVQRRFKGETYSQCVEDQSPTIDIGRVFWHRVIANNLLEEAISHDKSCGVKIGVGDVERETG